MKASDKKTAGGDNPMGLKETFEKLQAKWGKTASESEEDKKISAELAKDAQKYRSLR